MIESVLAHFENNYDNAERAIALKHGPKIFPTRVYNYEYDVAGNLIYLRNFGVSVLASYSNFTALGQPGNATTYPNPVGNVAVSTTYTYSPDTARLEALLTQKWVGINPGEIHQNLHYEYDAKGNILFIDDDQNGYVHGYTYDSLDRLKTAQDTGRGTYNHTYEYDKIGNILSKSDFGTYTYDYATRPHAVKSVIATGSAYNDPLINIEYNYDQKPNLIKRNGTNYLRYTYDGNGQRIKKENLSTGNTVLYFGELYENRGGIGVFHIFAGNRRVASIRTDGKNQFYHPNHLGSASIVTDLNGDWKERIEYYPFGTYLEDVKNPLDPNFPDANYTFTDQEDDDEIGLYNYGARLYDPILGRFISPDSIVQAPDDPQTLNRYAYARNNPLIYVDPSGNLFIIDDILIGAAIGAIIGGATAAIQGGNILQGMAMGAITGSFMGPASGGGLLIEAAAGAAAGATNAAIFGGDIGQGALSGAMFSVASNIVAGVMPTEGFELFGNSKANPLASIANRLFDNAAAGAAFGATYAGMTGGDIGQGAARGAIGWAAGEAANMMIGHTIGFLKSGKGPEFERGAFVYSYESNKYDAFSVGGVVVGDKAWLERKYTVDGKTYTVLDHEIKHALGRQRILAPSYIPAHFLSQGISGMIGVLKGGNFMLNRSTYNLLEKVWIEIPRD
jgi:RHS repeat-associated protein